MRRMRVLLILGMCLIFVLALNAAGWAAGEPKVGMVVGNANFTKVTSPEDPKYLGLDKEGPFALKDIKSEYLIVESFSTTCPHCMTQAPILNQLFRKVAGDAKLKGKIKFIAAGQGNNENAVQMWKKFHQVPFPVVADMERALGKAINFDAFPVTMLLDKNGKVLWVELGAIENLDAAFNAIKNAVN